MPQARQPHDPFTDAPLRPTTSNATSLSAGQASLRSQTSQHSLRSNASAASSRSRQQNTLFAPSRTRRPTSRTTPRVEDEVLADSESEQDIAARQRQLRRVRHGSPESKHSRLKSKQEEEQDFVNRQPDGGYLLGVPGVGETTTVPQISVPKSEEELDQMEVDAHYVAISRQFFASGASLGGKSSRRHEEELEQLRVSMMLRLREQVMQQLDDERWQYEPLDRFQSSVP